MLVGSRGRADAGGASVEAAKKLIGSRVNVIIGEMASGATIPMAQSVTIPEPHHPHLTDRERAAAGPAPRTTRAGSGGAYPSDNLQGRVLARRRCRRSARARPSTSARGTTRSVRRSSSSSSLKWKALGGKVGDDSARGTPISRTFDTEAGQLVSRQPGRLGDHRLPRDVPEVRPVARAHRQVGRHEDAHDRSAAGRPDARRRSDSRRSVSRGTAASAGRRPGGQGVRRALEGAGRQGREAVHGVRGHGLRCRQGGVPGGGQGLLGVAAKLKSEPVPVSGPPGDEGHLPETRGRRSSCCSRGKEIDYEGAFSPVDFDRNGDIGSAVYEIWQLQRQRPVTTLKTFTFKGR